MSLSVTIERARPADVPAVLGLLAQHGLPVDGARDLAASMLVARTGGQVVGAAALERYADGGLLRSVVVDAAAQGAGIGKRLVEAILTWAGQDGLPAVFLLTTTAADYFPRFGFQPVSRAVVPVSVQASVEFQSACPASAVVMRRVASPPAVVLFACVHNAGRSQMAAAWFNRLADPAKARAHSAGTTPAGHIHPEVIAAMREVGVDLSDAVTTKLTTALASDATMLITMGCGDECPVVPGVTRDDWPLDDPKGQTVESVRRIRDDMRDRVQRLLERQDWGASPAVDT